MKHNAPNYGVGDRIVCVDAGKHRGLIKLPLREGAVYTAQGISLCKCGVYQVDIGITNIFSTIECSACGFVTKSYQWIFKASRFVPLDEWNAAGELVEEVTAYELVVKADEQEWGKSDFPG